MYRISKQFTFSASHELAQMPDGHPCKRVHGHNYVVEVELSSIRLDDYGMILDYHEKRGPGPGVGWRPGFARGGGRGRASFGGMGGACLV